MVSRRASDAGDTSMLATVRVTPTVMEQVLQPQIEITTDPV
jgi:hypothetical protein